MPEPSTTQKNMKRTPGSYKYISSKKFSSRPIYIMHLLKAMEKSSLFWVLNFRCQLLLNCSWGTVMPTSSFSSLGKEHKSAGSLSMEHRRCGQPLVFGRKSVPSSNPGLGRSIQQPALGIKPLQGGGVRRWNSRDCFLLDFYFYMGNPTLTHFC